ncbi:hypothetical protein KIPB_006478 [Kipferlia bialata]|uniref:Uncharacterized protein n=1 Tax=Kipferlia bialata TaxID=797122 RepID=A0A9K3GJV4_9EUKA|nr:hypothetical protein KIPB_006478 [Kipferlia bialata]|eukprot:g6478.t1
MKHGWHTVTRSLFPVGVMTNDTDTDASLETVPDTESPVYMLYRRVVSSTQAGEAYVSVGIQLSTDVFDFGQVDVVLQTPPNTRRLSLVEMEREGWQRVGPPLGYLRASLAQIRTEVFSLALRYYAQCLDVYEIEALGFIKEALRSLGVCDCTVETLRETLGTFTD